MSSSSNNDLSYSMFIDNSNHHNLDSIQPRRLTTWVHDDQVTRCFNNQCIIEFSLFNRRHHCRACGRIFCDECTQKRIYLPPESARARCETVPGSLEWKNSIKRFIKGQRCETKKKERVCTGCYKHMQELSKLWDLIKVFELVGFDYLTLLKLSAVCRMFRYAAMACISTFRELQYRLISVSPFTELEKKLLWNNRWNFVGHSQWIYQLLVSNYHQPTPPTSADTLTESELLTIIQSSQRWGCWQMMCTRNCTQHLTCYQIVQLLTHCNEHLPPRINMYLVRHLSRTVTVEQLICFIPLLLPVLIANTELTYYLVEVCRKSTHFQLQIYHYITYLLQQPCLEEDPAKIYMTLRDQVHQHMSPSTLERIQGSLNLVCNIVHWADRPVEEFRQQLHIALEPFHDKLYLPFDINTKVLRIDYQNITTKISSTCPIVIPMWCKGSDAKTFDKTIIVKKEDLRRDQIIINIIKLMDIILQKDLKLDCNVMTYNVLPTVGNKGLIEIVSEADTIYNITKKQQVSILNYILENNPSSTVHQVRKKFTKSTAAYCVMTYLLGIGDRHIDNIMVSHRGELFHIDYGYILGYDPKMIKPRIKIIPEMIDALGGKSSKNFKEFERLCAEIYDCLRSHIGVFLPMILQLADVSGIDQNSAKKEVLQRFLPGHGQNEAFVQLKTVITASSESTYQNSFVDFLHYHNKENTIGTLTTGTYNWLIYLYQFLKN